MFGLKNWRRRRLLKQAILPDTLWRDVLKAVPMAQGLSTHEQRYLRELVILFLADKKFSGALDLEVTERMRLLIAVQACLLILNLGMDYYAGWTSIIVYPSLFRPRRSRTDAAGVVHENSRILSGEAWSHGPVILSWDEIEQSLEQERAEGNVVVHEFAHKLDMLNGSANGMPPLHREMDRAGWTDDFATAYIFLRSQLAVGEPPVVNAYAAESPAEFFAVLTEVFFTAPEKIYYSFPKVYAQLQAFYRQDPLLRRGLPVAPVNAVQMRSVPNSAR